MGLLIVSLFFITVWSFSKNIVSYFYEKNVYEVCIHKNAMNKLMFIRKQKKKKAIFYMHSFDSPYQREQRRVTN